jgi:hypothetical protein
MLEARFAAPVATMPSSDTTPRRRFLAPGILGGAALAFAATGAGLLGSVKVDYDRLASGPGSCRPCSDAQVDPLRTRAIAGYVMLGFAGALAVIDVVLWIRAARARR